MAEPALHPAVAALAVLLGTWVGEGEGRFPTVAPFAYTEQVTVSHLGKPFLAYAQRTWSVDDGRALHSETGYWRCGADGRVELVVAHPTGHAEVSEGSIDGATLTLATTAIVRSPSAKEVVELRRRIVVEGDRLRYELDMAAVGRPLSPHLRGELIRVSA